MSNFSITEAATAGFKLARRKPAALVVWAGVGLLTMIATMAAFFFMGGEHLQKVAATLQAGTVLQPQEMIALYKPLIPAYVVALVLSLLAYAILLPAVYRAILQPQVSSPGYLKLGRAELRQLGLIIVTFSLVMGIDTASSQLLRLVIGLGVSPAAVGALGSVAIFAALIFVTVRLSLSGPDSLVRDRFSLAGSWRLSRSAFGPMLATYALAILFQFMIIAALVVVMAIVVGGSAAAMNMGAAGTVIVLVLSVIYLVVVSLIYALGIAVMAAPTAEIYRDLSTGAAVDA